MTSSQPPASEATATPLRRREVAQLALRPPSPDLSEHEMQRLLHELQVHQIELEMQNESLRQMQAETDEALQR